MSWSTSELRVRLARRKTGLSPPVKYFTDRSKAVLLLWIFYVFFFCLAFVMPLCASVYMCLVVICWERSDLLALVCGVLLWVCHFPIGILGQVWYLIVSIPNLCTLTYFKLNIHFDCRYVGLWNACIISLVFIVLNVRDRTESIYPSIIFWVYLHSHCESLNKA